MSDKKNLIKLIILFLVGFTSYITIEVLYRGHSYLTMGLLGGIIFILIDKINDKLSWDTDLTIQALLGGLLVITSELIVGLIDRYYLHLNMWHYTDKFLNFQGIICGRFFFIWCALSVLAIILADFINYTMFDKSVVPYYYIFGDKFTLGIYKYFKE